MLKNNTMKDLNLRDNLTQRDLEEIYYDEKIEESELKISDLENSKEYSFEFGDD